MITGSEQTKALFWSAALSLLLVIIFLTPLRSNDLWWHLDSGRWMLQHGEYLGQEVRSFNIPGTEWPNFSWLFQVSIAAVEAVAGFWGLLLLKAASCGLMLFLLFRSVPPQVLPVALLLSALLLSWRIFPYLYLRPHLFEGVFLATAILFFHQARNSRDALWYALLILLWANCHGSVVIGAAAIALHYVLGGEFKLPERKGLIRRLPVGLLLWSMIFVTPNGFDILDLLVRHVDGDYLNIYIREWFAPDFLHPLMFIALIASITVAVFRRGVLTPAELLLIVLFLVLGNHSRRFQFELALLLIRPTAILLDMWVTWFVNRIGLTRVYWSWLYGLFLTALLIAVYPPPYPWDRMPTSDYPLQNRRFPHVAMAVLQPVLDQVSELKVLNDYGWGGYLGWQGKGKLKVYIDGRTPTVFSEEMMLSLILAQNKPQSLLDLARRWDVDAIVLKRGSRLPISLWSGAWRLVAFDSISVVYLRDDLARRYHISSLNFDPLQDWPQISPMQVNQAINHLSELVKLDADNDLAWQRLGQLLGYYRPQGGKTSPQLAMQALEYAIERNPGNITANITLSYLRQQAAEENEAVAQPLLELLDTTGETGLSGYEVEVASLLLKTGNFSQVIDVLSPRNWARHQQLDENFKVWLLRLAAHARLGDQRSAQLDRHMARQLVLDAGPSARQQLQAVEESIK